MRRALPGMCALVLVASAAAALGAAPPAAARGGDPDPSWGSSGVATLSPAQTPSGPAAVLPGGGLVFASGKSVIALDGAGNIVNTFGSGGTVAVGFQVSALEVDGTGRVLVIGGSKVVRLLSSGSLDTSWGSAGTADTGVFVAFPYQDPVDGLLYLESGPGTPSIERLDTHGQPDPAFNSGHAVSLPNFGTPGPVTTSLNGAGVTVIGMEPCPNANACVQIMDVLGTDGSILSTQAIETPGHGSFAPLESAALPPFGIHVVGDTQEEVVQPDGTLLRRYGQGDCGDPVGIPASASGHLSLLADSRTVDVGNLYDIIPHVYVRTGGRRDVNFGTGGQITLPFFNPMATFLASTDRAMWLTSVTGNTPGIAKVSLLDAGPALRGQPESGAAWMIGSDGGVIQVPAIFGANPDFCGSTGAIHLNQPIVGGAAAPDGVGYWLVASDGGVFGFGDGDFYGSTGGMRINQPVVGMAATPDGLGTGWWRATAGSSVSGTPSSGARPAGCTSTRRSSGWRPRSTAAGTG